MPNAPEDQPFPPMVPREHYTGDELIPLAYAIGSALVALSILVLLSIHLALRCL